MIRFSEESKPSEGILLAAVLGLYVPFPAPGQGYRGPDEKKKNVRLAYYSIVFYCKITLYKKSAALSRAAS